MGKNYEKNCNDINDDDYVTDKELYFNYLSNHCKYKCKYLPICLGGCYAKRFRKEETCIEAKYIINELIKEYLKYSIGGKNEVI